jgi:hypothetical protein
MYAQDIGKMLALPQGAAAMARLPAEGPPMSTSE